MDIDKLEAGPALDALVAEKVMGLEVNRHEGRRDPCLCSLDITREQEKSFCAGPLPKYSTDIASAWEVVEKLLPLMVDLTNHDRRRRWRCVFFDRDGGNDGFIPELKTKFQEYTVCDDAPLAICRAALKAVGA
jgi:hypothetical protein